MIERASPAVSLLLHAIFLALIAMKVFGTPQVIRQQNGMEIEIVDFEHAMPSVDPALPAPAEAANEALTRPQPPAPSPAAPIAQPPAPSPMATQPTVRPPVPVSSPAPVLGPGRVAPVAPPAPQSVAQSSPAQAQPQAAAMPAQPTRTRRLDANAMARSLGSNDAPSNRQRLNSAAVGSAIGQAAPRGVPGLTVRQRADLAEMVRSQVIPCWNPPASETGAVASVRLRFRLDRQGNVVGRPTVAGSTGGDTPYTNLLANSGRRAILLCAPLELPAELYDAWSEVEVNFDPRDLQ